MSSSSVNMSCLDQFDRLQDLLDRADYLSGAACEIAVHMDSSVPDSHQLFLLCEMLCETLERARACAEEGSRIAAGKEPSVP